MEHVGRRTPEPAARLRRAPRTGPGRPAGGGGAAAVRPRHWPFRYARAARRPPGPDPPARDRAGGRGGAGASWPGCAAGDGDRAAPGPLVCVDLGTGSGAIALSLAVEGAGSAAGRSRCGPPTGRPTRSRWPAANLDALARADPAAAGRVTLVEGPWFAALPERLARRVDLVVSNPPYVAEEEFAELDPTVRDWEPDAALVAARGRSGVAGLADVEAVVAGAGPWLRRPGAWWWSWRRPGLRGHRRRPPGRVRPGADGPRPGRPAAHAGGGPVTRVLDGGRDRRRAARPPTALADGAVVAVPTDTVYGLAVDPAQPEAVARLFALKGRPADVPLPVLVAGPEQVALVAGAPRAGRRRIWPTATGPARSPWSCPAGPGSPSTSAARRPPVRPSVSAGRTTRWSWPCASSSARWPSPAPTSTARRRPPRPPRWCAVFAGSDEPAVVLDGGQCDGVPSTVVECRGPASRVPARGGAGLGRPARTRTPGPADVRRLRRRPGLTVPVPTGDTGRMQHV